MPVTYSYLLFSQQDFLENLTLEELLRERANFYHSRKLIKDFWVVTAPEFLRQLPSQVVAEISQTTYAKQQFPFLKESERDKAPYIAILSTNREFITWIQLRFGAFDSIGEKTLETGLQKRKPDGISGSLVATEKNAFQILSSNPIEKYSALFAKTVTSYFIRSK